MEDIITLTPPADGRTRSPREIIQLYWEEVWNKGNVELIREICADPITRHDIGSVTYLSHDEQIRRVRQQVEMIKPYFTHEVLNADDVHVTSVWNMVSTTDPTLEICGIETFRAENGRFTHCWNAPYSKGRWGREGDSSVPEDLPPPDFVTSVEAMDHLWLQRMFKAAGVDVPRIAMVHRVEPIGNGTTSQVCRLHFGYNADAAGYPHRVVAKVPNGRAGGMGDQVQFYGYDREVDAYRFFGANPPFRIPGHYFAQARSADSFCLVMEDVEDNGRPGDQIAGCSVEEAEAVVREFTAMHRHYINDASVNALSWPIRPADRADAIARLYARGMERFRRYAGEMTARDMAIMDAVIPLAGPWTAARPPFETLIHGEPRVDNIMFQHGEDGVRACLIDLQQITLGDPIFDLAYFLSGSIDPVDRASCERRLVSDHAAALHAVHPAYDPEDAWERYCQNAISGLLATVGATALVEPTPHIDRLLVTLARRNCATIADLDGIDAAQRKIDRG
ncbi:MAG: phosphotransferase [Sphingobium sp.]